MKILEWKERKVKLLPGIDADERGKRLILERVGKKVITECDDKFEAFWIWDLVKTKTRKEKGER